MKRYTERMVKMTVTAERLANLPETVKHPYTKQRPVVDREDNNPDNDTAGWWAHMYHHVEPKNGGAETVVAETAYFDTPEEAVMAWNDMWRVMR